MGSRRGGLDGAEGSERTSVGRTPACGLASQEGHMAGHIREVWGPYVQSTDKVDRGRGVSRADKALEADKDARNPETHVLGTPDVEKIPYPGLTALRAL